MDNKKEIKNSIAAKINLIFGVLVSATLIFGAHAFFKDFRLQDTLKKQMQRTLKATARYVALQINGDEYAKLKPGDENTEIFKKVHAICNAAIKDNPEILWVYTFNKVPGNPKQIQWIVDNTWGTDADASPIGEIYDTPSEINLKAFDETVVEPDYLTDKYGTFISGYSPIHNSKGEVVGAVGVDITKDTFLMKQGIRSTIVNMVFFVLMLVAGVMITSLTRGIIKDLRQLTEAANAVSMGNMDRDIRVKRDDEIGELARSFERMTASIKILMMDDDKK